jgi:hypothetical protein
LVIAEIVTTYKKMEATMSFLIAVGVFYGMIKIFTWIFDGLEEAGIVRYTGPTIDCMGRDDIEKMIRRALKD